jgi:hypothetical protein
MSMPVDVLRSRLVATASPLATIEAGQLNPLPVLENVEPHMAEELTDALAAGEATRGSCVR